MLANHTSIRHLFTKCVTQYDKLMRRKAFLDQYEQHPMFADGLEEFDDARAKSWRASPRSTRRARARTTSSGPRARKTSAQRVSSACRARAPSGDSGEVLNAEESGRTLFRARGGGSNARA